jgi:predicted RecA/RadA family phage recombinase
VETSRRAIAIDPRDDVAVAVGDVSAGEAVDVQSLVGAERVIARHDIPAGHKIALREIVAGQPLVKYGERIGHATEDIHIGDHVHIHNVTSDRVKAPQS